VEVELAIQVRALVRQLDAQRRALQKQQHQLSLEEGYTSRDESSVQKPTPTPTLNDKNTKAEYEQKLAKSQGVRYKWER
jgi:hypothetical protein